MNKIDNTIAGKYVGEAFDILSKLRLVYEEQGEYEKTIHK